MAGTKKTEASGSTRIAKASAKKKAATKKPAPVRKKSGPRARRQSEPRITLSFVSNAITVYGGLAQIVIYLHAHNPVVARVLDVVSSLAISQFGAKLEATRAVSPSGKRKGPFDVKRASVALLWAGSFPKRFEELAELLASQDWIAKATDDEIALAVQLFSDSLVGDHGSSIEPVVKAAYRQWKIGQVVPPAQGRIRQTKRV